MNYKTLQRVMGDLYQAHLGLKALGMRNDAADLLRRYRALWRVYRATKAVDAAGMQPVQVPTELLYSGRIRINDHLSG